MTSTRSITDLIVRAPAGEGRAGGAAEPSHVQRTALDVRKATTIAQGCAAAAFDTLADTAERNGKRPPPSGRYWASGGEPVAVDLTYQVLHALVVYLEHEPDAPAEALYSTACGHLGKHRGAFDRRPEAERLAFAIFAQVLRPMLDEIKRARKAAAVVALPPPLDKGIFRRTGKIRGGFGKRLVLSHPPAKPRTDAAE